MLAPCCRLLQLKNNVKNDNKPQGLLLSFAIEAKQQKMMTSLDLGLSLSFPPKDKNQEMMTNLLALRCLLHLRIKPRDSDELRAFRLVIIVCIRGKKTKRQWRVER